MCCFQCLQRLAAGLEFLDGFFQFGGALAYILCITAALGFRQLRLALAHFGSMLADFLGSVIQQLLVAAVLLYTLEGACQAGDLAAVLLLLGYLELLLYLVRFVLTERIQWLAGQRLLAQPQRYGAQGGSY